MTCSNWMITLLSLVVIILALWPNMLSQAAGMWISAIAGFIIILIVWSGCNCKWCQKKAKGKR